MEDKDQTMSGTDEGPVPVTSSTSITPEELAARDASLAAQAGTAPTASAAASAPPMAQDASAAPAAAPVTSGASPTPPAVSLPAAGPEPGPIAPIMPQKATIIVHSGDFDKIYSAFIIGSGALAMGMECTLFFTFWGLLRLKKGAGLDSGPLSKMHMLGLGKWMIRRRMKKSNVVSLEKLAQDFKELGGKIMACDMTMEIMGVSQADLRTDLIEEYCAVGSYINEARESTLTLFI